MFAEELLSMSANDNHLGVEYFVINLPSAGERRAFMLEQAEKFGLHLNFVSAVSGKELTDEERLHFDRERSDRYMPECISDNEIACALSHRKALKAFLDSGAAYGVIFEDDALLMPHFSAAMEELLHRLHGWEIAKLYTADGTLYPVKVKGDCEDAVVHAVIPRKILWIALANMYTRHSAEVVYKGLNRFWRPADAQIGDILLREEIPTIGVAPSPVVLSELSKHSCIDDGTSVGRKDEKGKRRTFMQYCRYRFYVSGISRMKVRMRRLMEKLLQRE